ncbi:MAG: GNAT family protein [Bacteroidota bacterium]
MITFPFTSSVYLEDERVLLRPLGMDDFPFLRSFSILEPEIWTYSLQSAAGEANMRLYMQQAIEARTQKHSYAFIVFDKNTQEYAGCTRFYDIQETHECLQLGYTWYGKKFQGTGLNTHCKYLLLSYAFDQIGIKRVELRADSNNSRSIHAMKKIGCTVEGILRSNMIKADGNRRSSMVLSILKEEWDDSIKSLLVTKMKA